MPLTEQDQKLLLRCLARQADAWNEFVDRFMGLVVHVVDFSARARDTQLSPADREDLCGEVFVALMRDDCAVLRHFRGQCSLATYLAVVARRVCVREIVKRKLHGHDTASMGTGSSIGMLALPHTTSTDPTQIPDPNGHKFEDRIENREEVERLMSSLSVEEAAVVRLYHLEGRSYREVSEITGMPENSIGPTLSRARDRLRTGAAASV